jgi:hypothetical protein
LAIHRRIPNDFGVSSRVPASCMFEEVKVPSLVERFFGGTGRKLSVDVKMLGSDEATLSMCAFDWPSVKLYVYCD